MHFVWRKVTRNVYVKLCLHPLFERWRHSVELTAASRQSHPGQRLQHGALPRALVSDHGDSRQRQVLLHPQRAERVDEVDAGTHLLLVLLVQGVHEDDGGTPGKKLWTRKGIKPAAARRRGWRDWLQEAGGRKGRLHSRFRFLDFRFFFWWTESHLHQGIIHPEKSDTWWIYSHTVM